MSSTIARVAGAHTGVFSRERVFIHQLPQTAVIETTPRHVGRIRFLRRRVLFRRVLPVATLFFTLLFHLFVRIEIIHSGYRVQAEREKALELDRKLRELNSQLAEVTTPKRILERAEKELGLSVTPPQRIRTVTENQ